MPIRFADYAEFLEDRTLLAASLLGTPLEGTINAGSINELQLTLPPAPGGSGPASLGFLMSADNSSLNPAAIQFRTSTGTAIAPVFSDPNRAGGAQSLAVVNMGPGEFTILVGGDNNTAGAFTMDIFLPGDMDGNGHVSSHELLHTEAALVQRLFGGNHILAQFFKSRGIDFSRNLFHANMDANLNGVIDPFDVNQAQINSTSPAVNLQAIEFIGDNDAPEINARVTTDTGPSASDNITSNLNVEVTVSDDSNITSFTASLDGAAAVDLSGFLIPGNLDPDGSTYRFSFTQNSLASTFGVTPASLANTHTISFFAEDELFNNNNANPFEFTFTLDQISPSLDNSIPNQITDEDVDLNGFVDLSVVFSDGLPLTFAAVSNDPSLVTPLINSPLSLDVQDDQNGTTTITVTATDLAGNSTQDTFDITVRPVNDEPSFTVPASDTVLEDSGPRSVSNFASNFDPGAPNEAGQTFNFNIVGNSNADLFAVTPAIDPNGNLTYTPAGDANGSATISVETTDDGGTANGGDDTSQTLTFDIFVTPVNDEPSFTVPASDTVLEDSGPRSVSNFASNFDPGAPNEAAQTFNFNIVGNSNADLFAVTPAIDPNGNLTYTPAGDANGSASISVETTDDGGIANGGDDTSQTLTFDILVTPVNDEPTFTKGPDQNVNEDSGIAGANSVPGWATNIRKGPANESGQNLTFIVTNDNNSLFSVQPDVDETTGDLIYTLASNAFGSVVATVTLMDDGTTANAGDDFSTQTFNINVSEINDPPIGVDDGPVGVRNDPGITTSIDVLINDIDPDLNNPAPETDFLTLVEIVSSDTTAPGGGAISGGVGTVDINNNQIDYTPPDTQERDVTIVYRFQDNNPNDAPVQATATLTIFVRANQNPTPQDDNAGSGFNRSTDEDTATTIDDALLLANDNDPDGDDVSLSTVNPLSVNGAIVSINGGGDIEYDPINSPTLQSLAQGSSTTDTFDYTISDGLGGSGSATVTITVTGVNDAPVVTDETANATEDGEAVTIITGSDDIDSDDNSATLTYTILSQPDEGNAGSNGDGTFTYDPGSDFQDLFVGETRQVSFTYNATDSHNAGSNTGTVTITVTGVNDAPVVTDESGNATEDGAAVIITTGSDDIDNDDNPATLTYTILSQPDEGSAGSNDDGTFTFDPGGDFQDLPEGQTRQVNFTYKATDSHNADGNTGTVTITVTGVNDDPVAVGDTETTDEDTVLNVSAIDGVLSNDFDVDLNDTITVAEVNGQVSNVGTQLTLPSGAVLTLNSNGSFTYDPNGGFEFLNDEDIDTDTFDYTIVDDLGGTDTATVSLTIDGINDPVTFLGLNDIVETLVDPPDRSVNLDDIFSDPEGGAPTYSNPSSDNPLVNVSIRDGNVLDISYTGYSPLQDRSDPIATITVTATDPDNGSLTTDGSFNVVLPQFTLDVQIVFRHTETQADEFTFFSADAAVTNGRFQLVSNGSHSLIYFLSGLATDFDLDGNQTIGNPDDDVTALRFIDSSNSNAIIFDILSNDADLFIDPVTGEVEGRWDDGEVDIDPFLTRLRTGQLAVQIVTNTDVELIGGENIQVTGQLATLPASDTTFIVGNTYVAEVWIKDLLEENLAIDDSNGLAAASVDVTFDGNLANGGSPDHTNSPFDVLQGGTTNNTAGIVDNLSGGSLNPFIALEPAFARLGFVPFTAAAAGNPDFELEVDDVDGILRRGSADQIDGSQINITVPIVQHVEPSVFQVDVNNSQVIVTVTADGVSIDPQQIGISDRTSLSGDLDIFLDDLSNPSLIELIDAELVLENGGSYVPDPNNLTTALSNAPANLGYQDLNVPAGTQSGQLFVALRDTEIEVDSNGEQASVDGSGNFNLNFTEFSIDDGFFDFQLFIPALGNFVVDSGREDTDDSLLVPLSGGNAPGPGQIVDNGGTWELTIPLSHTITEDIEIGGETSSFIFTISGSVLATFTPPAPLLATEPREAVTPSDGTAILMTLSRERTTLNTSGGIEALPESEPWIHEWDSFWVELWANTSDGAGIDSGSIDLSYNANYFTATEIDHGRVFRNETSGTIWDDAGLIDDLGGIAAVSEAGGEGFVLLGRVKFESLEDDQVTADLDKRFFGPFDLGLGLSDARVNVSGTGTVDVSLGESPGTELWSVVYDINDDNEINFEDFSVFSSVFRQDVFTGDSPFVSMMDFNNDGTVDFGDMSSFAGNFRLSRENGANIQFPERFVQRWAGVEIVTTGSTSVDDVVDAAVGAWQTALELTDPISIQVAVRDIGTNQLGDGQILAVGANGRPTLGRVVLDDDAGGLGWYTGLGTPVPEGQYDLYTVLLHEIGHVLGFSQFFAGFAAHVSTSPQGSILFVGQDFTAVLTSDGLHLDEETYPNDVMNETLAPAVRKEISDLDVRILRTAYEAALNGSVGFVDGASAALHTNRQTVSTLQVSTGQTPDSTTVEFTINTDSETPFASYAHGSAQPGKNDLSSGREVAGRKLLETLGRGDLNSDALQKDEPESDQDPLPAPVNHVTWVPPDLENSSAEDDENSDKDFLLQTEEHNRSELDAVFTAWDGPIVSDGL